MPDNEQTTLQFIHTLQQRTDLNPLELELLDRLTMAMEEVSMLEAEVSTFIGGAVA